MKLKYYGKLLKITYSNWSQDNASRFAAALSYYTAFSIAPLLIICISIVGFFYGKNAAKGQLLTSISQVVGKSSAHQIQVMLNGISNPKTNIFSFIIGIVFLIFGAIGAFQQLQDGLNTIWKVEPISGKWQWLIILLKKRLLSFIVILGLAFLLLLVLVLTSMVTTFSGYLNSILFQEASLIINFINFLLYFGISIILFIIIFQVLPDAKIAWKDAFIGAFFTAILFVIGKLLLGFYIGLQKMNTLYGAAAPLLVILIWVYYSAQILFFGAEFTKAYAEEKKSPSKS